MKTLRKFYELLLGLWFIVGCISLYIGMLSAFAAQPVLGIVLLVLVLFSLIVFAWMFLAGVSAFFRRLFGEMAIEDEENLQELQDTCMKWISLSGLVQLALLVPAAFTVR